MARYLSQEQIADQCVRALGIGLDCTEFRECFSLHDRKRNGKIRCTELSAVMRSLSSCPTLKEIEQHLKDLKKEPKDEMDFTEFLTVMYNQLSHEEAPKEIMTAFKLTDERGRGTIPASYLKHILMKTGENLTEKEVEQMFRAGNIQSNGSIRYDEFVRMVTLPVPDYN